MVFCCYSVKRGCFRSKLDVMLLFKINHVTERQKRKLQVSNAFSASVKV